MTESSPPGVDSSLDQLMRYGFVVVPSVLPDQTISSLRSEVERLEDVLQIRPENTPFEGHRTKRIYNLLQHSDIFWELPTHDLTLAVVRGVLGDGCRIYNQSSIAIEPGESAQPIHCDDQIMTPLTRPHPATLCVAMWTLTEFSAVNGSTRLYPRSHLHPQRPEFSDHPANAGGMRAVALSAPSGSLIIWHGSLWHGAGANQSTSRRVGVAVNYCSSLSAVHPSQYRLSDLTPDTWTRFPPGLRKLVSGEPPRVAPQMGRLA